MERRADRRHTGPAYYLGRSASDWIEATSTLRRPQRHGGGSGRRRHSTSVALVTGGGRGLGRCLARSLAGDGVAVGLVARSSDELAETLGLIEASGGAAAAVAADVTDASAVAGAVGELSDRLGPVDLLVNNAGIPGPCGPSWDVDPADWWRTVQVNLLGTFTVSRLALDRMVPRRHGRIVNITSHAGVHRWPTVSAYSVAKAAVIKFTENLALETRRHGISVFGVDPGVLPIGFTEAATAARQSPNPYEARVSAWIRGELDEGRGADPSRVAGLVAELASGRCDDLTGRQLSVHDDLDEIRNRIDEIQDHDLYVLALRGLGD